MEPVQSHNFLFEGSTPYQVLESAFGCAQLLHERTLHSVKAGNKKFQQRYDRNAYIALFSNVGCENKNHFYLLMTYHCSRKGGFGHGISVEKCKELVKKENPNYKYVEYPQGDIIE
jgi:hypothetical protein